MDISTIAPEARQEYIRIGRAYSTALTLAQINKHLSALQKYGAELVQHGFSVADQTQLEEGRDALEAESAGRTGIQVNNKVLTRAHRKALAAGEQERQSAQSVLAATARALRQTGGKANLAAATTIDGVLLQTRKSPRRDGEKLADQLEAQRSTLTSAAVAAAAADRGGPAAVTALTQAITRLRASNQAIGGRGTLSATERLDLIEGLLVTLARNARKAARAAAKRLGLPAVAAEFELSELKSNGSAGAATTAKQRAPAARTGAATGAVTGAATGAVTGAATDAVTGAVTDATA